MTRHFVIKEIIETMMGPKFIVTFIISCALVVIGIMHGFQMYQSEVQWHAQAMAQNRERLENLGSYGALGESGGKVFRAPEKMSIFVRGLDSVIGRAAVVSRDAGIVPRDSRYSLNPIFAVFGELDLAFIVKFVLSLFALLYSYNAVSGERETGTLKLVFSNVVSRSSYMLGKALGGLIPLVLSLLIPILFALAMLLFVFEAGFSLEEWLRIGLIIGGFVLYLALFYCIGFLASCLSRTTAISFLICLFVWVTSVALLPRLAVEMAGYFSPVPSVDELEARRATLQREFTREMSTELQRRLEVIARTSDTLNSREVRRDLENELRKKYGPIEEQMIADYRRRQRNLLNTAAALARLSPTSSLTFATNRIAVTDSDLEYRYVDSVGRYRTAFLDYAERKMTEYPELASAGVGVSFSVDVDDAGQRSASVRVRAPTEKIAIDGLPPFTADRDTLDAAAADALPDFALMGIELLVIFCAAFVVFARYDVR